MEVLDPEKVKHTNHINTVASYGLTIVIGLPLLPEVDAQVQQVQTELEQLVPERFAWYAPYHRHLTVAAPLRGRYRESPPVQRQELPDNLADFVQALNEWGQQLPAFTLVPELVRLRDNGMVSVQFQTTVPIKDMLIRYLNAFPMLDAPKHSRGSWLYHTMGYATSLLSPDEQEKVQAYLDGVYWQGEMAVSQVWLVHYAIRTLQRIKGKIPFRLQQANTVTEARLLRDLQIG